MKSDPLCRYLDWDSDFFGFRIARVTPGRLGPEAIRAIVLWCEEHRIDCLYFLADADDERTLRLAEDNDFNLVDVRTTYSRQMEPLPAASECGFDGILRPYRPDDLASLLDIARASFRLTRFYFDSHFPTALSDALYQTWTEKSCNGYADMVLVAEACGYPAGYVSCHLRGASGGQIGLVGVTAAWQGKGVGRALVRGALEWFKDQGTARVEVVTQGRNCQAQRLYQRSGFLLESLQLWYHRWFKPPGSRQAIESRAAVKGFRQPPEAGGAQ